MSADNRYCLVTRSPASWWNNKWREALPSGNGTIGAAVYGGVREETVLLNHTNLWRGGKPMPLPDVSSALPAARKLMTEGQYAAANRLLADTLLESGYRPELPTPLPLGDLSVVMPVSQGFRRYRRSLNMETGEVTVGWLDGNRQLERCLFVSRANDTVVCRIKAADAGAIGAKVRLALYDPQDAVRAPHPDLVRQAETVARGDCLCYASRNDDGADFGAVCRIVAKRGRIEAEERGGGLTAAGEGEMLLLIKLFVGGSREKRWEELRAQLSSLGESYEELLDAHVRLHRPLFHSMRLRLCGDDDDRSNEELLLEAYDGKASARLMEKMWAYGRYLLLSATGERGNPSTLYGLWGGDYTPIWSQYVANQNVQMMLWHAPAGGMAGQLLPMFAYYEAMLPQFRDNARKLFGARGIYIPAYTAPGHGAPAVLVPVIANWTGAAGWLAQHFYQYYAYTGDETFLRERALPFMREAALFYRDYFTIGADGYFYSHPSVSPENSPANHAAADAAHLDHPMPTSANATLDFAIARELLGNLAKGCRTIGTYPGEIPVWEDMLRRIPPYQINADGALKEWMDPAFDDNYNHRHISHLYPLFPGTEITARSEPELFAACRVAVEKRSVVGISDQSGWSLTHLANLYARLGQGDEALECLHLLARSCLLNNFYTVHNDWRGMGVTLPFHPAPVQLDANMGLVSAVQEMLLFASEHAIRILPALPSDWYTGSVERIRFHSGAIDMEWDRRNQTFVARLEADRAAAFALELPAWLDAYTWESDGEASVSADDRHRLNVKLAAGQQLRVTG